MKKETKNTLSLTFKSLFSNQAAIDSAKTNPWWIAIIIFILGVFLPVIPLMVQTGKTYGASFINSTTNGFETKITTASLALKDQGYEFTVNNEHKLISYKNGAEYAPEASATGDETPIYIYINTVTDQIDFEIYYTARDTVQGESSVSKMVEVIEARRYQLNGHVQGLVEDDPATADVDESKDVNYYIPSYIVLYKDGIYAINKAMNSTTNVSASYSGSDWTKTEVGFKLIETVTTSELPAAEQVVTNKAYCEQVEDAWENVFNTCFLRQKNVYFWSSTGIYLGIYVVLALFMGLLIFLLTRGKRNMFNYLKFHTCLGIEAYSCLAPGLLAMILGFMMSQYAMMFFIILLGLRTMWMSMKQLRPQM